MCGAFCSLTLIFDLRCAEWCDTKCLFVTFICCRGKSFQAHNLYYICASAELCPPTAAETETFGEAADPTSVWKLTLCWASRNRSCFLKSRILPLQDGSSEVYTFIGRAKLLPNTQRKQSQRASLSHSSSTLPTLYYCPFCKQNRIYSAF